MSRAEVVARSAPDFRSRMERAEIEPAASGLQIRSVPWLEWSGMGQSAWFGVRMTR
jgi:hypothetical protein